MIFVAHLWQGELCLKFCGTGEQGGSTLLALNGWKRSEVNSWVFVLTVMMNSRTRKRIIRDYRALQPSGVQGRKVVTWLILPVVICLSQRLSHACLSINKFVLWNCEWLIKSVIVYLMLTCYMDNCGNSRANTCNQAPTSGRGVFIR
jgi:hypothetical protein